MICNYRKLIPVEKSRMSNPIEGIFMMMIPGRKA